MAIPSAPATSPAMAAGRGSPNAMPAGLSALLKPDSTPRGMPSGSIQQIMNTARKMSDSQLADVLAGRSIDIPQYVAMTEAMGRKKLRIAMQGAQAQAQMQQPSLKNRMLAETSAGLDQLPAPNMNTVDMADGGIVAFNGEKNRQLVTDEDLERLVTGKGLPLTKEQKEKLANTPNIFKDFGVSPRTIAARGTTTSYTPEQLEDIARKKGALGEGSPFLPGAIPAVAAAPAPPPAPAPAAAPAPAPAPAAAPAAGGSQTSGIGSLQSYMDAIKANQEDYYKQLAGLGAKQREGLAQLRRQGGGEALMNLAQGLLSRPGLAAGIAAGLPGVTTAAAASRKEQRAVENLANEYDFNLAKARAADAKGNTEAALKYMQLADEAKYRAGDLQYKMAALNQGTDAMRNAQFLAKNPEMAKFFPSIAKPDIIGREKALEQFNKLPKSRQKEYGDFENYFRFVNNQGLYATLPGQGADVIGTLK